jgi:hypothetical protein
VEVEVAHAHQYSRVPVCAHGPRQWHAERDGARGRSAADDLWLYGHPQIFFVEDFPELEGPSRGWKTKSYHLLASYVARISLLPSRNCELQHLYGGRTVVFLFVLYDVFLRETQTHSARTHKVGALQRASQDSPAKSDRGLFRLFCDRLLYGTYAHCRYCTYDRTLTSGDVWE